MSNDTIFTEAIIKEYQCSGCVNGPPFACYKTNQTVPGQIQCMNHIPGTFFSHQGQIFLGLPQGFNRLGPGPVENMKLFIFPEFMDGWGYDMFNVPVWKYRDKFGHIIVRGLCPRSNSPFLHIFLEDCLDRIDCREITNADLQTMD